jgi:hypothetical protein
MDGSWWGWSGCRKEITTDHHEGHEVHEEIFMRFMFFMVISISPSRS